MRRGLMRWDAGELPLSTLETRISRLRAAMARQGLDAFVLYTNLVRPSAVTWLTGFTPYWSEALLLVPREGRLLFATALSNRVADWIRSTNPVSEVVSTPRPGALIGERLAKDTTVRRVGVLELDALPSELSDHLAAAVPDADWVDASALFAALRRDADAAERALTARADTIAKDALAAVEPAAVRDAGTLAGVIEEHARRAAAEEAYIAVAPNLDADRRFVRVSKPVRLGERFAARASVAYKGCWVRRVQTFAADPSCAQATTWLAGFLGSIAPGKPFGVQLAKALESLPGAKLTGWMMEGALGSYPLQVIASSRTGDGAPAAGQLLVATVELSLAGVPWIGAGPAQVEPSA